MSIDANTHYWIVVVSKDHIKRGIAGGFVQANHGKQGPLNKMKSGDWVICYSPKQTYAGKETLQAFTAIGQVANEDTYQFKMSDDFMPYRRDVNWKECTEVAIQPLIQDLNFIENKQSWGYRFRFGFFEIPEHDFKLIKSKMLI